MNHPVFGLEALADRGIASELETRQLCARIDLQIRRLLDNCPVPLDGVQIQAIYQDAL